MTSGDELKELNVAFTFTRRPTPVPGDLRPVWKLALVILILHFSRGKRSSLERLHLMSWASRTRASRYETKMWLRGASQKQELVPRIDPSLNRAVDFAIGEGLIAIKSGKSFVLTEIGDDLASEVVEYRESFTNEIEFLEEVSKFATQTRIDRLLSWSQIA